MIAYKFLRAGAVAPFTDFRWPPPTGGKPGRWIEAEGPIGQCENGVHTCRVADLPYWLDEELWALEIDRAQAGRHQIVAGRARLLRRIEGWTLESASEYGLDCMTHARRLGAEALEEAGLGAEAAALSAATAPDEVRRAGHEGSAVARRAGAERAARASYAAGTAGEHMTFQPSTPYYFTYPAFAAYAAAVVTDTIDPEAGYEKERRRQAGWLASRLGLPGH